MASPEIEYLTLRYSVINGVRSTKHTLHLCRKKEFYIGVKQTGIRQKIEHAFIQNESVLASKTFSSN